jgi:FkbM family methyltransferase
MSLHVASPAPLPYDEKIYQLIRAEWTVVVAAVRDDGWVRTCALMRPGARYMVFPHDPGEHAALARALDPLGDAVALQPQRLGSAGDSPEVTTLDQLRAADRFNHLHYLRIDTAAAAMDVLLGAKKLLRHSRINLIEIADEPGGADGLAPLALLLAHHDYIVMRLEGDEFKRLTHADIAASRWTGKTLAIHSRLLSSFIQDDLEILDLPKLLAKYGVTARGIIQVGAHKAEELPTFLELGAKHVLLVEANPALIGGLRSMAQSAAGVTVAHCAINDVDGPVELHVANLDKSSSILPLKLHLRTYPGVVETGVIEVPGSRLDTLLASLGLDGAAFNVLCIDIQGAELRALRGATRTLETIEAISIEINFDELYEGCAQVEDIDDFLADRGFDRVATLTPYHSTWGDALYVRRNFALTPWRLQ